MRTPVLVLAALALCALGLVAFLLAGRDDGSATVTALRPETRETSSRPRTEETRLERPAAPVRAPVAVEAAAAPQPAPATRVAQVVEVPTIAGRVVDAGGNPLAATVDVFVLGILGRHELASTLTDADGHYRVELDFLKQPIPVTLEQELARSTLTVPPQVHEALEVLTQMERDDRRHGRTRKQERDLSRWFEDEPALEQAFRALHALSRNDEGLRLCVRATAHGYSSETTRFAPPDGKAWSRRVDFKLNSGGNLTGRILMLDFPAAGAEVRLLDQRFEKLAETVALRDGSFSFTFRDPGVYHVVAYRTGDGVAMHADLELTPLVPIELADLVLGATGSIEGHVAHPDGTRPIGALVEAVPIEFSIDSTTTIPFDRLPQEFLAGDLFRGFGQVTGGGSFAIGGLQPGLYELRLPELTDPAHQPGVQAHTGAKGVELVYLENLLVVHVTGVRTSFDVRLVMTRSPDGSTTSERRKRPEQSSAFVSFSVVSDATYHVFARTEDGQEDNREVVITPDRYLHTVVLRPERRPTAARDVAADSAEAGRLHVKLMGDDGEPTDDVRATLAPTGSSEPLSDKQGAALDVGNRWVTLSGGDYVLRLENEYLIDPTERAIRVQAGQSLTFKTVARLGGRVALQLTGPAAAELPEAFDGELTFLRIPSSPVAREVRFARQRDGSYLAHPPLAPGPYTLRASPGGHAIVHEGLELVRSRTVEVAVGLE